MRPSSNSACAALVVLALIGPSPARADDDTPDAHLQAGLALRRQHKNEEALVHFRRAYELAPTPRARAQIGFANQALGRWVEAESDLHAALAADNDEWVARNREPLETALGTIDEKLGWLTVTSGDIRASLAVDGAALSEGDAGRLRLPAGPHMVRVTPVDSRAPTEEWVDVPPRQDVRVVLMAPAPPPASADSGASPPSPPLGSPKSPAGAVVPPPPARPAMSQLRVVGFGVGAVGIAGIATSLVLGGLAMHESSVVSAHCVDRRCDVNGLAAGQVGPSLATASTVAFVVGAVGLGAGAALVFFTPAPRSPSFGGVAVRVALP